MKQKWIRVIILLALMAWVGLLRWVVVVDAQGPTPSSSSDELVKAIQTALHINYFQVRLEDVHFKEDWAYTRVFVYDPADSQSIHNHSFNVLARRVFGEWFIAFPGDPILLEWLQNVPSGLISGNEQNFLARSVALGPADSVGHYKLPYPAGLSYPVTGDWDDCRIQDNQGNCILYHRAIDFGMPEGHGIVAAMTGEVVDLRSDSELCGGAEAESGANFIKLYHADVQEYTVYVHLKPNSIPIDIVNRYNAGEIVQIKQGEKVGEAGHSGWTDPPCNGDHLHFVVEGLDGTTRNPYFIEKPGTVWGGDTIVSQNTPPASQSPPTKASNLHSTGGTWYKNYTSDNTPSFAWTAATDPNGDLAGYYIAIDDPTPDGKNSRDWTIGTVTNWSVPSSSKLPDGAHFVAITSRDSEGHVNPPDTNVKGDAPYYDFIVDTRAPSNPASINPGCSAANNIWQNACNDPNFTWSGASDGTGSGIKDYHYYWGDNSNGMLNAYTVINSYDPPLISDPVAIRYLRLATRDNLGQESVASSLFVLRYDSSAPTVSLAINGGAPTTNQTTVRLDLNASDMGSGLAEVRVSNNNLTWSAWQSYADTLLWTLSALDRRSHTVYVQVRDKAGNLSAVANDAIELDLYPPMPHSASYRICQDVLTAGGSVGVVSANYSLASAIGQPWGTGATANTSSGFGEQAGFLVSLSGCLPITHTTTSLYDLTRSVIAAGGNLRGSSNYRLGDTTGQPAASPGNAFSSANYILSSGFWAQITGTIPLTTPVNPPTPTPIPTITPTPGPTPTPQPGGFGVSINDGALYTNNAAVTVSVQAPNVTHLRLSNDGGYADVNWQPYQVTSTWVISTYGDYVLPRNVYAWFRDADKSVYGPYFDDIIYDPVPPEGQITVLGTDGVVTTITLWLEAWDDNSGVTEMRLSDTPDMASAAWQSYTETVQWPLTGDAVYAQFRDGAGNLSTVYSTKDSQPPDLPEKIYLPIVERNE